MNRLNNALPSSGFTLVELIVALTVVSVALTGFIAMFNASMGLSAEARHRLFAAEIAEMQLNTLAVHPEMFTWHTEGGNAAGVFPIHLGGNDPPAGNLVSPPDVRLAARAAQERAETLYRRFRWQAWGRLPSPDAQAYEITVSVRWSTRGRQRVILLTSSLPRHLVVAASESPQSEGGAPS